MATRQLMLPGDIVKKSNELARAAWAVESVLEPRIVALTAARVRVTDKDFQTYEIPTTEILPSGNGEDYAKLKQACRRLLTSAIDIPDKEGDGWTLYSVFSMCRHDPKRMVVQTRFDPGMKSHYLELAGRFTEYNLFEFLMLPTTYSQRLFEVLKSWDDQPERIEPMDALFKMLGVPLSMQRYPDFRRKILQPAHAYITEKNVPAVPVGARKAPKGPGLRRHSVRLHRSPPGHRRQEKTGEGRGRPEREKQPPHAHGHELRHGAPRRPPPVYPQRWRRNVHVVQAPGQPPERQAVKRGLSAPTSQTWYWSLAPAPSPAFPLLLEAAAAPWLQSTACVTPPA